MTIAVDWDVKHRTKQNKQKPYHDGQLMYLLVRQAPKAQKSTHTCSLISAIVIHCLESIIASIITGFKLGPDSREKWLLPPGKIGRSDSQIGRSYSAKLQHFLSVQKQIYLAITHTIAIKWKEKRCSGSRLSPQLVFVVTEWKWVSLKKNFFWGGGDFHFSLGPI